MYIDRRELVQGDDGNYYELYYRDVRRLSITPRGSPTDPLQTGYIVKWIVFFVLVGIMLLWIVGGYFHAQRRMKRGLPPMAYHRVRYPKSPWTMAMLTIFSG